MKIRAYIALASLLAFAGAALLPNVGVQLGYTRNLTDIEKPTSIDVYAPAQIILRWHVQEGFSVIPGSRNESHIRENIAVYDFSLSADDMEKIRALDTESRFYTGTWESAQAFLNWKPAD